VFRVIGAEFRNAAGELLNRSAPIKWQQHGHDRRKECRTVEFRLQHVRYKIGRYAVVI
jgi:hypothetical protein